MKSGIQDMLAEAGEAACYALALGNVAEEYLRKELNACTILQTGIDIGAIYYNPKDKNDNDNFFVKNPALLLKKLTGINWEVRKENADYIPMSKEYTIQRWERTKTGQTIGHFRRMTWDSLTDSQTVRYGKIVSQRICLPID